GRGEEAVAGQDSAGNHFAFGTETGERKDRRVFERCIAVDLAFDVAAFLTGGIDQDEIGLKPAGGVERELIVVLFADEIFSGAFQCSSDKTSDVGFVIEEEDFFGELHIIDWLILPFPIIVHVMSKVATLI